MLTIEQNEVMGWFVVGLFMLIFIGMVAYMVVGFVLAIAIYREGMNEISGSGKEDIGGCVCDGASNATGRAIGFGVGHVRGDRSPPRGSE